MSEQLKTINRGEVDGFGYSFGGVQRVLLGELPPMQTPQFCEMAGQALVEVADLASEEEWIYIGKRLGLAFLRDKTTKAESGNPLNLPSLLNSHELSSQDAEGLEEGFVLQETSIPIELWEKLTNGSEKEKREIMEDIRASLIVRNGWVAERYSENPFVVMDQYVEIGGVYQVEFADFGLFVGYILAGGMFGWDTSNGMPREAKKAIANLREIWG